MSATLPQPLPGPQRTPRVRIEHCLVTGGCGFMAQRLVEGLVGRGYQVRVLDRVSPDTPVPGVEYLTGSITEEGDLRRALQGVDTVFHTASIICLFSLRYARQEEIEVSQAVNVEATRRMLALCEELGVPRFIYTSSNNVLFDRSIDGGDETEPYAVTADLDVYTHTKVQAERAVLAANSPNLSTCALRPGGIYGPGGGLAIPRLVEALKRGQLMACFGPASSKSDNSHVDNLAMGHMGAAEQLTPDSPVAGEAYFLMDGEPLNYFEFFRPIVEDLGYRVPRLRIPLSWMTTLGYFMEACRARFGVPARPFMTRVEALKTGRNHWFRIDKARRDFGYEPLFDSTEGVRRCLPDAREQFRRADVVHSPPLWHWAAVLSGMVVLAFIAYHDGSWQLWSQHVLGALPRAAYQWTFVAACAIHFVESLVALRVAIRSGCRDSAGGWVLQTLLLGGFSLRLLVAQARGAR